jgi:hypothetical protein
MVPAYRQRLSRTSVWVLQACPIQSMRCLCSWLRTRSSWIILGCRHNPIVYWKRNQLRFVIDDRTAVVDASARPQREPSQNITRISATQSTIVVWWWVWGWFWIEGCLPLPDIMSLWCGDTTGILGTQNGRKTRTCKRDYRDVSNNESPSVIWKITRECLNLWKEVVSARFTEWWLCVAWWCHHVLLCRLHCNEICGVMVSSRTLHRHIIALMSD